MKERGSLMGFYFNIETIFDTIKLCKVLSTHFPLYFVENSKSCEQYIERGRGGGVLGQVWKISKKNCEIPLQTAPSYLSVETQVVTLNSL